MKIVKLLPDDQIFLYVREKKLAICRIIGYFRSKVSIYDLNDIENALEIYKQLKKKSESGKLKHVKII